jgi:hypothetical protein
MIGYDAGAGALSDPMSAGTETEVDRGKGYALFPSGGSPCP